MSLSVGGTGPCGGAGGSEDGSPGNTSSSAASGIVGGGSTSASIGSDGVPWSMYWGFSKWSMRGGVACPGAIGVAGLVPGLDGTDCSSAGEGKGLAALITGSLLSQVARGVRGCLRTERDRSDPFGGD